MAQKKRDGKKAKESAKEEEYEFPMPDFDEKAFMRREIEGAKTTFWTALFALFVGGAAWAAQQFGGDWRLGAAVIVLAAAGLGPFLRAIGYSEESTTPKALIGNWFLLVFTALSVWTIALNV